MLCARPNTSSGLKPLFPYLTARLVSNLANPLFIPPLVFFLLGWMGHISISEFGWLTGFSILFYSVIPLGATIYLLQTGHIKSVDLPERENRTRLFICSILSSSAGSLLLIFYFYAAYPFLAMAAVVFLLNPIAGLLINLRWKISVHTAAIATAGAIFLSLFLLSIRLHVLSAGILSLIMFLIFLPLMIWARYYLRIHSVPELIGGAIAGIIFTLIEISIMLNMWHYE